MSIDGKFEVMATFAKLFINLDPAGVLIPVAFFFDMFLFGYFMQSSTS